MDQKGGELILNSLNCKFLLCSETFIVCFFLNPGIYIAEHTFCFVIWSHVAKADPKNHYAAKDLELLILLSQPPKL